MKERFHERNEADSVVERHWDRSELDTAGELSVGARTLFNSIVTGLMGRSQEVRGEKKEVGPGWRK